MKRVTNLDWLPIKHATRDLRRSSNQIVILYRKGDPNDAFLQYCTSNPDYAIANAAAHGYTEFAILIEDI